MYSSMLEDGIEPNAFTYVTVLKACGNLLDIEQGKQFHRDAQEKGFDSNIFVASSLVSMYGKCGDFLQAESLFREMQHADDVAWSGMMSAYIESGQGEKALLIYRQMSEEGVNLYSIPLVFAIQACCILTEEAKWNATQYKPTKAISSIIGRALHADGRRKAVASDGFVGSTLINFYNKIKSTSEATAVFSGLIDRDVVAWTAILAAYVEDDQVEEALQLYVQMQEESVSPNRVTFLFAFQACGTLADREDAVMLNGCPIKVVSLDIGRALHFDAKNKGFTTDDVVGSSLVSMYGKCGAVSEAETAFNEICNPDIIAWTAMLSAYLQEGSERKALTFYKQMQEEQIIFTDIALANVLQACRGSGSLEVVQELHFTMISALDDGGPLFANTLVHAYAACSSLVDALAAFEAFSRADVVTWTNCITAYSLEGNCSWCSEFFHEMQLSSLKPDGVTFLSLLSAFRHGGLIDEAVEVFQSMHRVFCVSPNLKHYAVMIDLMARAGNLNGVEMFLQGMPEQADSHILNGLIGSCCTHGNVEFGKLAFGNAVNLRPMGVTAYILMSNLYASVET
ncbi:hypothetical protein KP509_37G017500 [Ceratopteris richardii]|nr:hypothetical protein KP509_37G017500 [Ceratopteris richardii]